MSCNSCDNTNPKSFQTTYQYSSICSSQNPCNITNPIDSACVIYGSSALGTIGIATGDSVEVSLQKVDNYLAATTPNGFPTYNYSCLANSVSINTQQQFVETISDKVCTIDTNVNTLLDTTFPAYQATINTQVAAISNPAITCSIANVTTSDNLQSILNKYCTTFSSLNNKIDISGVTWATCFDNTSIPQSIADGFSLVEQQLCTIKTQGVDVNLPTFDNTTSCLDTPSTTDSLVDTVNKIKIKLCETTTSFDATQIIFGCVTQPSVLSLTNIIKNTVSKVTQNTQGTITQVVGGTLSNVDNNNLCAGKVLTITGGGTSTDRFVAASSADTTPGTLADKLEQGAGIDFNFTSDNKVQIISEGTVKASTTDQNLATLSEKLTYDSAAPIIVSGSVQGTTVQSVLLSTSVNEAVLIPLILNAIQNNSTFKTQFCSLVASCTTP